MRGLTIYPLFFIFALLNGSGCGDAASRQAPAERMEAAFRLSLDSLETVRNRMLLRHDTLLHIKKKWLESEGKIVAELGENGMNAVARDSALFAQYKTLIVDELAALESVHNELIIVYSAQINDAREREKSPPLEIQLDERALQARERYHYLLKLSKEEKEMTPKVAQWEYKAGEWLGRAKIRTRPPLFINAPPQARAPIARTPRTTE